MTTHRSLNKLEFKAHMSIHNMVEVSEGESHPANFTRDRFQKKHRLTDADGRSRIVRRAVKTSALALLFAAVWAHPAAADDDFGGASTGRHSTDIRVDSSDIDDVWNKKFNTPQETFGIPVSDSSSVGFNEDGDPSLSTRF